MSIWFVVPWVGLTLGVVLTVLAQVRYEEIGRSTGTGAGIIICSVVFLAGIDHTALGALLFTGGAVLAMVSEDAVPARAQKTTKTRTVTSSTGRTRSGHERDGSDRRSGGDTRDLPVDEGQRGRHVGVGSTDAKCGSPPQIESQDTCNPDTAQNYFLRLWTTRRTVRREVCPPVSVAPS